MAFLSEWDGRARPKGSRDPLGFELVWSHYGRKVIGNLTTVTASLENFSVALLGFYWANELNPTSTGTVKERSKRIKETFLRYEQLAGYLRHIHKTGPNSRENDKGESILGSRRIKNRIETGKITLGPEDEHQILSSQATQGLWGLYYSAMKATELVKDDDRGLTDKGKEIARLIEQKLDSEADKLKKWLEKNTKLVREDLEKQCKKFFDAIRDSEACGKLLKNLMMGSNKNKQLAEVQIDLWEATRLYLKEERPGPFVSGIKDKAQNADLLNRLSDIESVERLLVAMNNLFRYFQRKNGAELSEVIKEIGKKEYDYKDLRLPECHQLKGSPYEEKLTSIRNDLFNNNVEQAITKILELNGEVMKDRGGAPWIEIEKNKTLLVRVPDETAELLDKKELQTHWDNSYFLYSYLAVARNWGCGHG